MKEVIIVSRHSAMVDYLIEQEVITKTQRTKTILHATPGLISGKHVIGVLPHHLSCLTASYTEPRIICSKEMQGRELTLDELRECIKGIATYKVVRDSFTVVYKDNTVGKQRIGPRLIGRDDNFSR